MIIGYLLAMVCLVLFIPWLYTSLIITLVQDIRKPSYTPPQPHSETRSVKTTDRCPPQEEDEVDEEMEFYDYMCGDPDPQVVYEDDPHFVFPRIKVK